MNSSDQNPSKTMDGEKQIDHNYVYNPCDMNTTDFNPDIYMSKILKDFRLSELMDTEQMLYRQIQTLDSEMQTLIYENYNKFISATETVKKMTSHFDKMEYELDSLAENMNLITERSNQIAKNLSNKREQMTQMAAKNNLLAKIQFILELPNKMKEFIKEKQFKEAVDDYLNARYSLDKYSNQPSFKNIQMECNQMLEVIKEHFYEKLTDENSTGTEINESIGYLAKLNECPTNLCEKYLQMCEKKLVASLDEIKKQTEMDTGLVQPDILEFIDNVCNNYLSSLNESITFYTECFLKDKRNPKQPEVFEEVEQKLKEFVDLRMENLFEVILGRIRKEQKSPNHNIIMFVRALDKFYRRIQSLNQTVGFSDFSEKSLKIIHESTRDQCNHLLADLTSKFQEELSNVRHDFINDIGKPNDAAAAQNKLSDTVIAFETSICENLKSVLSNLNPFLYNEATFINKEFKDQIFGDLLVKYIEYILESTEEYADNYSTSHVPPCLILFLSKICKDLSGSIIQYLFRFTEDLFKIAKLGNRLSAPLIKRAGDDAQRLLNAYVWTEGQSISHMIRKSVETRDWLSAVEPRSVRSVMKRIIEDISLIDFLVGQLYEEGTRIERSSDNSSRTFSTFSFNKSRYVPQSNWSYGGSSFDNNIASNIQKLFNDKIEIFGKVEFSKLSVTTGIVKIGLKTLIECSRLCTFSRFGFQQMQVDAYYLQTRLWRFASDEKIIVNLIDEVISSTKKRCLDPVGMERSVVENICENV